jgi:hypothetical protein
LARRTEKNLREFDLLIELIGVILVAVIASVVQSFSNTDKAIIALASAFGLYVVLNERSKRRSKR